jgi:hypothetical protein
MKLLQLTMRIIQLFIAASTFMWLIILLLGYWQETLLLTPLLLSNHWLHLAWLKVTFISPGKLIALQDRSN